MYGKCGRIGDARRVFDALKGRNLVCWNAMISGYCVHGDPRDGISLFEEMVGDGENSAGISPDEVTFVGILSACARGGFLEEGNKYFEQMTSLYQLKPTFAHYWCMANLYGGLGLIQEAEQLLKCMPEEKESLVWSGLLGYCRFRGDIELGERIGKQLIELEPFNGSRYALLWNVYMAAGRWEDAQNVKELMKERGVRTMTNGRLVDLNEIVHNFKVGDRTKPEIEKIYAMMDDLAVSLKLPGVAVGSTESTKLAVD
ncbi:pentatricopeptide repeat-containing protein At3g51320-like [Asparagus officinalis]|uniref:pentatricopeptide repeat-containing protein At3g51320-like n=1 Tax=Asparagus officinalis TaxID=4686 RepID=UPI00098E7B7E|nr:pentatricopeptide repeat-containing protein At3g51320-like [Asparagus officinalis]